MVAEVSLYEIALRWMPLDLTDDKSTLVQVMAWCHQATSHYLSQCWPRSMSPNGVTRPQWVNSLAPGRCGSNSETIIFKFIRQIDAIAISWKNAHLWMSQNLMIISQYWLGKGGTKHQAITWAKVDPDRCCHLASFGNNDFNIICLLFFPH